MPSSLRARSSTAASPDLRSSTSAPSAALRCLRPSFSCACCSTCWRRSATERRPPSPHHRRYCRNASSATSATSRSPTTWFGSQRIPKRVASALQRDEGVAAGVLRGGAEGFLDAQQLVVLGHAVAAAQRAGLDLRRRGGDRDVRDGRVLGFAG